MEKIVTYVRELLEDFNGCDAQKTPMIEDIHAKILAPRPLKS
jgi:hypothetical protein